MAVVTLLMQVQNSLAEDAGSPPAFWCKGVSQRCCHTRVFRIVAGKSRVGWLENLVRGWYRRFWSLATQRQEKMRQPAAEGNNEVPGSYGTRYIGTK